MLKFLVSLIPLLPLLAVLWIAVGFIFGWNRGESGEKQTTNVVTASLVLSLFLVLGLDIAAVFDLIKPETLVITNWLSSGKYQIELSFLLDYKSLIMATLISIIGLLVARFSVNYLHREAGYQRFFMLFSLFIAAMYLITLSGNAVVAFIGWELAGVSSYLLIAYSWHRDVATKNATRAFVTNRIGDAGFILGISSSLIWLSTIDWVQMSVTSDSSIHIGIIVFGFMIAAFAKSAQLPFSAWITRALEGPTPSSAVFYGSLMVHAGVFLFIRIEPLLLQVPALMLLILLVGALTATYGYFVGLVQTDVKSSFMFSTLAQVGLMMVWIGMGWFDLALGHIVVHAIWRAYQFLHAPSFMQQVRQPTKQVPQWLSKRNGLFTAALNRLWLDDVTNWLLTRPTNTMAKEIQFFDGKVVDRVMGISSNSLLNSKQSTIGHGSGFLGSILESIGSSMQWLEERIILKSSGDGLLGSMNFAAKYLELVDKLLTRPRYVLVLIIATFVVVL